MDEQRQTQNTYMLRSGVFVSTAQAAEFERLLTQLLQTTPAQFVMLADVAGQVILAKGEHSNANLVMLGSLVAGDLAASQEIARLTGEYQDYQIILREGQHSNSFIAEASSHLALLVQADKSVPMGWARMLIVKTARQLANTMRQAAPSAIQIEEMKQEAALTLGDAEDDLADLVGDALDDMWGE